METVYFYLHFFNHFSINNSMCYSFVFTQIHIEKQTILNPVAIHYNLPVIKDDTAFICLHDNGRQLSTITHLNTYDKIILE